MQTGRKFDNDKDRWDLLPVTAVKEVVKVLTYGAKKYDDNNWQYVEDAHNRYFAAALRHLVAWREGEQQDAETKLHHLAHAICCLLFLITLDFRKRATDDNA